MPSEKLTVMEQLLYFVSARGKVSWQQWKEACESLAGAKDGNSFTCVSPASAARILDELGHVEILTVDGRTSIAAAPAMLARLPRVGLNSAIFCGGRAPDAERCLGEAAARHGAILVKERISSRIGAGMEIGPAVLRIDAEDSDALDIVAKEARLPLPKVPPAWLLAHSAGSIEEYVSGLDWSSRPEPNMQAKEYCLHTLRFGPLKANTSGMRLLHYSPRAHAPYYDLRDGERAARVDRQWGMAACLHARDSEIIIHDRKRRAVAVPLGFPLPRPLGRTLALCSGEVPRRYEPESSRVMPHLTYLIYYGVPSNIADTVLACLGQTALPFSLPEKPQ